MTLRTVQHDGRTGDIASAVAAFGLNALPAAHSQPEPTHPAPLVDYDPYTLLGIVVARLEDEGRLPHESVPKDIEGAVEACRKLLTALGMKPAGAR